MQPKDAKADILTKGTKIKPKKDPRTPKKPSGACEHGVQDCVAGLADPGLTSPSRTRSTANPGNADIHYCKDKRELLKQEHPSLSLGDMGREMGKRWQEETMEVKKVGVRRAFRHGWGIEFASQGRLSVLGWRGKLPMKVTHAACTKSDCGLYNDARGLHMTQFLGAMSEQITASLSTCTPWLQPYFDMAARDKARYERELAAYNQSLST